MARRRFSSVAARTALASPITNVATSLVVTAAVGYPGTTPFTIIVDADTVNEEVMEVTGVASTTFTVTRGVDSTTAVAHSAGAVVQHGVSARDFDEANAHVNDVTTDVHSQYMQPATGVLTRGVVGATTGTVTTSSNVPNAGIQWTAATGSGTTTSTANFRCEFNSASGTSSELGIWNKLGDVIPAATVTAMGNIPIGSRVKFSNAGGTTWRSAIRVRPGSWAYSDVDNRDWYVDTDTVLGDTLGSITVSESSSPGMYLRADWTVYTLVTSISNLDALMAAEPTRVLSIGGVHYPRDSFTVSGGTVTLTYSPSLSIPVTTAVSLGVPNQAIARGTGGTDTYTLGFVDTAGFAVEGDKSRVELGSSAVSGQPSLPRIYESLKVTAKDSEYAPAVVVLQNNAVTGPGEVVLRSAWSDDGLTAVPNSEYVGELSFEAWDGTGWKSAGSIRGGTDSAGGSSLNLWADEFRIRSHDILAPWMGSFGNMSMTGTGWTSDNAYSQVWSMYVGKTYHFAGFITVGSSTVPGTGGLTLTSFLPTAAISRTYDTTTIQAHFYDISAGAKYTGHIQVPGGTTSGTVFTNASPRTAVTSTVPFTWAVGDVIAFQGTYERS